MIFIKFISVILCVVVFSGCGQNLESDSEASISKLILSGEKKYNPQKLFKSDTDYFLGLRALKEGKVSQAERLFRRCAKNGSLYCAKKSYVIHNKTSAHPFSRKELCQTCIIIILINDNAGN